MLKFKSFQVPSANTILNGRCYYSSQLLLQKNVIISHGFGSSMLSNANLVKPLVKVGFRVILFNFKQFHNDTDDTSVLTEKQNLISMVRFVKQNSNLKTLDLVGCSQGGLVSALVANDYPRLINKLALLYPAFCIPHDARMHKYQSLMGIKLNSKYINDAKRLDPWIQILHYRRPVLLCHGNRDQLVNIKYSEKAHSTYKNSKLVTIRNGDHGFQHGFVPALTALVKFLKM